MCHRRLLREIEGLVDQVGRLERQGRVVSVTVPTRHDRSTSYRRAIEAVTVPLLRASPCTSRRSRASVVDSGLVEVFFALLIADSRQLVDHGSAGGQDRCRSRYAHEDLTATV